MEKMKLSDNSILAFERQGQGRAILFIHGLGAESSMYRPQIDHFSKNYQVIVPDLRGNGQSDKLDCPPDEVLDRQANDILELLHHLGVEKAVVCGISYGGIMTIHLMTHHPEIFEAAVLDDTFCVTDTIPFLNFIVKLTLPLSNCAWFMQTATKPIYKRWPLAANYFETLFSDFRGNEAILQRKAILCIDYRQALRETSMPVLCMAGDYGKKLVEMMETILESLPRAEHFVIANSFDPSNLCQPEVYNKHIDDFLDRLYVSN